MARARILLIVLIALAVTMAPIAGALAMAGANAVAAKSAAVSMQHDCCDNDDLPASKIMDNCRAAAGCSFACFSIAGPLSTATFVAPPLAAADYLAVTETFRSHGSAPPLPPPRV
jgi:hypothetical protein